MVHPRLVQNLRGERSLILREETPVVLGDSLWRVLDRVTRLLVRTGLLENVRSQHIAKAVWSVREQAPNRSPSRIWIEYAVACDCQTPSLVERILIICRASAGCLAGFHKER